VQQTKQSRRCALSPSHELANFVCQHRTMSVVWTAQTSRAQDSAAIYLSGCISVWNPSKPPRRSSLGEPYVSRFFLLFLWFIPKITQPTSIARNYKLKHKFFSKKILYCVLCYLIAAWFSHTLLTTLSCALSQANLWCV